MMVSSLSLITKMRVKCDVEDGDCFILGELVWCDVEWGFFAILQKPDMAGMAEFLKPLNEVMMKASALTEGRRPDFFNHLKTCADSLSALFWIAYTGKDCGKRNVYLS